MIRSGAMQQWTIKRSALDKLRAVLISAARYNHLENPYKEIEEIQI